MSRSSALITLGVLVILSPLSGLPASWIAVLSALLGAIILVVGISIRSEHAKRVQQAAPAAPIAASAPIAPAMPVASPIESTYDHPRPSAIA